MKRVKKKTLIATVDTALRYILMHATDKQQSTVLTSEVKWLEAKLKEIARLARIARKLRKQP